jgi:hypothetical protein
MLDFSQIPVFGKQLLDLAGYSIDLELEGFETPKDSILVDENSHHRQIKQRQPKGGNLDFHLAIGYKTNS